MQGRPPQVEQFAEAMVRAAREAVGVQLDYTPETLPFLDHYRNHYVGTVGKDDRGDRIWRPELLALIAPMAGAYFGEVVRRSHQTRWVLPTDEPTSWRMEFVDCFMYFSPMGIAVESFLEHESESVPGAFQVAPHQREGVLRVLEAQPEVREQDFYTFTVRWETLDIISFHLLGDKTLRGDHDRTFSEAEYRAHIDD